MQNNVCTNFRLYESVLLSSKSIDKETETSITRSVICFSDRVCTRKLRETDAASINISNYMIH